MLANHTEFVVSGSHFNMNFLLLTIQSTVCVSCVITAKRLGVRLLSLILQAEWSWSRTGRRQVITFRDWDKDDARKWFPISFMLVSVIYTGSKSLVSHTCLSFKDRKLNDISCEIHSNTFQYQFTQSSRIWPSSWSLTERSYGSEESSLP